MLIWQIDPVNLTPYYNAALCAGLVDAGQQVVYFTSHSLYDPDLVYPAQVTVKNHYFRGLEHAWLLKIPRLRQGLRAVWYPFDHLRLLQNIRQTRPDVVHVQWSRLPRFDAWLVSRIRALGIPVVHTVHDVEPLFGGRGLAGALEQVYAQCDALILHSEASRQQFQTLYPRIPAERLFVVPLLAATDAFVAPPNVARGTLRQELGIPTDAFVFLVLGNIKAYKGVDLLIEAFQQAHAKRDDLHLILAGIPDAGVLPNLDRISNLHTFFRYIYSHEGWRYHLAADVVVFPYRKITQSAALITAMQLGCPVIATEVGAFPETIEGNGWLIPPQDVAALADALLDAVSDPARLQEMGQRSAQLIAERHHPTVIAENVLDIYRQIIG